MKSKGFLSCFPICRAWSTKIPGRDDSFSREAISPPSPKRFPNPWPDEPPCLASGPCRSTNSVTRDFFRLRGGNGESGRRIVTRRIDKAGAIVPGEES